MSFIAELKARLPEADWPVVVAALRNQAQAWAELQESEFGNEALDAAGGQRSRWSPAFLGLLRLNQAQQYEALRATPMQAVSEDIRYQAAAAYEQLAAEANEDRPAPSLEQATLLALALRERRRLLNGWEQLANDLSIASAGFWELPIACLFGMLPKQHELLEELLSPQQSAALHRLGLHALVANPLSLDVQSSHLLEIIQTYPLPQFLNLLRSLAHVHAPLARQAALHALENIQEQAGEEDGLARIQSLLLQAEVYQISGQPEQAAPLLSAAWEASQKLQAELAERVVESAEGDETVIAAVQESAQLSNPKNALAAKAANKRPAALLSAAKVALKSEDTTEAKDMAIAALNSAAKEESREESQQKAKLLRELGDLFIELDLPQEAEQAAMAALDLQANDSQSAALLSHVMLANGKAREALDHAHLATALEPERSDLRRNLAKALQENGDNSAAFVEWQAVVAGDGEASNEDWLALAETALQSGNIEATIKACQQVLSTLPTSGAAYALLGQALLTQGDETSAMQHLQRSTELSPTQTEAWLGLAALQRVRKDAQTAAGTLLAAQQYVAPSAKLQALLAELYVELGRGEEALPIFERTGQLATEQLDGEVAQRVALKLAALQRQLGNREAALRTLEVGQQAFPANPEIAYAFGKTLLEIGEPKRAIASLKIAQQADPANIGLLMELAQAQLAAGEFAAEAEQTLLAVLNQEEAPLEALPLLADALAAQGKHSDAVRQYDAALRTNLGLRVNERKTLLLGKAQSQAATGKPVAAMHTLQALDKEQPNDMQVLQALVGAYKQAGRSEEAAELAQQVFAANTGSETVMLWYADQMRALGKSAEACKALGAGAKSISTNNTLAALGLAKLQWEGESKQAALNTFGNLMQNTDRPALISAATFLLEHGAAKDSLVYFQRAAELEPLNQQELEALTIAYMQSEDWSAALDATEMTIALAPHNPQGFERKAEILQRMGRPQAALESLAKALEMLPQDARLLTRKAQLLREQGDWTAALDAATKAFDADIAHPGALLTAAELALINLKPQVAQSLIARAEITGTTGFELACLQAEIALDAGEEVEAARMLGIALDKNEHHPRVLALQAQIAILRGDRTQAELLMQQATEKQQAANVNDTFTLLGIAKAAERLNDWKTAVEIYADVAKAKPGQVIAQFSLGRAIVQRAEWQRLCSASQATNRPEKLDKQARKLASAAFAAAGAASNDAATQTFIAGWQARAELRLGASHTEEMPAGFPASAGEAAALFAVLAGSEDAKTAEKATRGFINAADVLIERALAETDAAKAYEYIAGAAKSQPNSAPVLALAAFIADKAGETQAALEWIERAVAMWSNQPKWQALAGELQSKVGNLADASSHFTAAAEIEPDEAKHFFALGQTQLAANRVSESVASLSKAVKAQPNQSEYLLALARAHRGAGDTAEAKSYAQQAHKAAPKDAAPLVLQAELALEAKDLPAAKGFIEDALALAPKLSSALKVFAEVLHALGQPEDAIAVLDRARETAEDEIPLLIRRAQMLPQELSLDALIKLSQRYADRSEVFFALSQALTLAGNVRDAVSAAQRAVKVASEAGADILGRMQLHLGQLLKQSGNLDQSLHHLEEAINLAPNLLQAHIERGRVFLSRRQQGKALQAFQQAAATAPLDAAPHYEAALALKEAKDYNAAERELRAAAKLAPKDRNIQRQLAAVIALNIVHHPQTAGVEL